MKTLESLRAERDEVEKCWRYSLNCSDVVGLPGEIRKAEANEYEKRLKALTQEIWNHPEF